MPKVKSPKQRRLTPKQRLFCLFYIEDFNATRAYLKAYKCSYRTAVVEASKSLIKPNIKAEIDSLINSCLEEQEIKSKYLCNAILQKYIDIAFADIVDFVDFGTREVPIKDINGNIKTKRINYLDFKSSEDLDTSIIAEIKTGKGGSSIKLHDKLKALEFLSKYLGMIDFETKEKLEILNKKLELDKEKFEYTKNKTESIENDGVLKDMLQALL